MTTCNGSSFGLFQINLPPPLLFFFPPCQHTTASGRGDTLWMRLVSARLHQWSAAAATIGWLVSGQDAGSGVAHNTGNSLPHHRGYEKKGKMQYKEINVKKKGVKDSTETFLRAIEGLNKENMRCILSLRPSSPKLHLFHLFGDNLKPIRHCDHLKGGLLFFLNHRGCGSHQTCGLKNEVFEGCRFACGCMTHISKP